MDIPPLFALILIGLSVLPTVACAESETITIVADRWCPYNCDPGSKHPGFMIEIAQKAFAKHNISIEYSILPWTRAINEARQGTYTAIVGAAHKDAPDFIFPKTPQGWMNNTFYVIKGNAWRYSGISSLDKVSLGTIADYSFKGELNAYIAKHKNELKFVQVVSGEQGLDLNVKKLLAGRIGATIEAEYVMSYYLAQHGLESRIEKAGSLFASKNEQDIFIAFSPKNAKSKMYAEILTKETRAMRDSGELQKILAPYNVSDWYK